MTRHLDRQSVYPQEAGVSWAHAHRARLLCPFILPASPLHSHGSHLRNQRREFRDLRAECSEGPGLEPWQPDSTPALSPSVQPWAGDWWTQFIKNELWTDRWKKRSVKHVRFFCEPKCTSVVFSVCQQRATMNSQVVWQRLIYGDLLNSTSWLTTRSF